MRDDSPNKDGLSLNDLGGRKESHYFPVHEYNLNTFGAGSREDLQTHPRVSSHKKKTNKVKGPLKS